MKKLKRIQAFLCAAALLLVSVGCDDISGLPPKSTDVTTAAPSNTIDQSKPTTPAEWVKTLTLHEKAAQMVQGAIYNITESTMKENDYGSALSGADMTSDEWREQILNLQKAALASKTGIPYVYGNDSVHGVGYCRGAVIFPHNIGIGAANDTDLTYKMGLAVADESKIAGILWNFSPCLASAKDPRWGRTYESYSSDLGIVTALGTVYAKGMVDGGILPCAKHFFAEGNVGYGTGEDNFLIDRGDATLNQKEIDDILEVYKSVLDAGVRTVMISHSAINGVKMHENKELITDVLKGEMGFTGLVVSDWESIHHISGDTFEEQVINAVNAGIDMLMEPDSYDNCIAIIEKAVNDGRISQERINDAVTRILTVKYEMGIFDDPMMENLDIKQSDVGSDEYRDIARQLVEKSLVLLKNENNVLPIKRDTKIFFTGLAGDNTGVQCGGWTVEWNGQNNRNSVEGATTILDGFKELAGEYGLTIITDEAEAANADITVLCVGESSYSEWNGDTTDLSLTGSNGISANNSAIERAKNAGNPIVTLIVAGRNVIYDEYESEWDAVVMCYLPGSEGDGVANVLTGKTQFSGKLPMPYYRSIADLEAGVEKFPVGYGLTY